MHVCVFCLCCVCACLLQALRVPKGRRDHPETTAKTESLGLKVWARGVLNLSSLPLPRLLFQHACAADAGAVWL